ncbi:uncharacterized protein [Triticum aestivum]|uniref:uncharacterized protein n=1 Tax=Triticum aestivum TaxID=4565 RepID=UPI001D01C7D6|nr:uncharacterized protein LOC123089869 [Triticum aestivum]
MDLNDEEALSALLEEEAEADVQEEEHLMVLAALASLLMSNEKPRRGGLAPGRLKAENPDKLSRLSPDAIAIQRQFPVSKLINGKRLRKTLSNTRGSITPPLLVHSADATAANSPARRAFRPRPACLLPDLLAMSADEIRAEINTLIASKFAEGTVDQYFLQLYVMWRYRKIRKGLVVEVIERYLHDADKILTEIAVLLNQPQLDYDKVEGIAEKLEGCSSSSVGAKRVNLSCVEYLHPEAKTKEGSVLIMYYVAQ